MSVQLSQLASSLGFKGKLPKGATDITKNPDGSYKITVNGQDKNYNADGSVFSAPAKDNASAAENNNRSQSTPAADNNSKPQNTPVADNSNSGNGNGNADNNGNSGKADNNSSIFGNRTSVTGSFNIDPAKLAATSMNLNGIVNIGAEVPFGLGGMMSQGAMQQNMQDFMNSVNFNFDFKNLDLSSPQFAIPGFYPSGTTQTPSGGTSVTVDGATKTVAELAKDGGYEETATDGVYKKGDKYYKYDVNKKEFVEVTAAEAKKAKEADEAKANEEKDLKEKEKVKKEAAKIAEDLYDAMKGAGTKNDKLQAAIDKINKDNVIEVMDAWDSNFADAMDGESLLEAIQGEHHTGWFGNTQEKQENAILKALTDRAEDEKRGLGLDTEAAAARAKVNSEHSAMFTSDDTVRTSIENLAKKIREKEGGTTTPSAPTTT